MRRGLELCASTSLATIAFVFAATGSHGQAFLGNASTGMGSVSYSRSTPGVETIFVNSSQATINWRPTDTATGGGDINFLPSGNTATYSGPSGGYTVLNRIIAVDPSRRIALNGNVTSDAAGSIWFYAPGGILVGSNARFNVGSLLLTAGDPKTNAAGQFLTGGSFGVTAAAGSTANITINPGAQINALTANSYVVAVAPSIQMNGTVNVNGSAAMVAAEAVDFTYNAGLFDIMVTQGAGAGNTLALNGSIIGTASRAAGDYHRIYLVAIPKNTAMTMLIQNGATLGFDVAGAANMDGNAIVLSSGYNVRGVVNGDPFAELPLSATQSDLNIRNGVFTSMVTARATSLADVGAGSPSPLTSFASDLTIRGGSMARVTPNSGNQITVAGNLTVSAVAQTTLAAGASRTAGTAIIDVTAGTGSFLTVGGNVLVDASAFGDALPTGAGSSGSATGGNASIQAFNGNITINGNATVRANATGGRSGSGINGGDATAGSARIAASTGFTTSIGGTADVQAVGSGGGDLSGGLGKGGFGKGGSASIASAGGTVTIGGAASADTTGRGGNGALPGTASAAGTGGVSSFGNNGITTAGGSVTLTSQGFAGLATASDGIGGVGTGGTAQVQSFTAAGRVTIGGDLTLNTSGVGGLGGPITGPGAGGTSVGGKGQGGTSSIEVVAGVVRTTGSSGTLSVTALGFAGQGATVGAATGGTAQLLLTGGSFTSNYASTIDAHASGNTLGLVGGGTVTGGTAQIYNSGAGAPTVSLGSSVTVEAFAFGSNASAGTGGATSGGTASVRADSGSITIAGPLQVMANAALGDGLSGGAATGGLAQVRTDGAGATIDVTGAVSLNASGNGGTGTGATGIGGAGTGGTSDVFVNSGTIVFRNTLFAQAIGGGAIGGQGGAGTGGFATLEALNGSLTVGGSTTMSADAAGGGARALFGGAGGAAIGGSFQINADTGGTPGVINLQNVQLSVTANAGVGGSGASGGGAGGRGGDATGGSGAFNAQALNGRITAGLVVADATAFAGRGGAGGSGATGGVGGRGGDATGGFVINVGTISGSAGTITGYFRSGAITLTADAIGGGGGSGGSGTTGGSGGRGGDATGGRSGLLARGSEVTTGAFTANANTTGGNGGTGTGGARDGNGGNALVLAGAGASGAGILATQHFVNGNPATVTLASITANANATGGSSGNGIAGSATAGEAYVRLEEQVDPAPQVANVGTLTVTGAATLSANGTGGNTNTGTAGAGTGGVARFNTQSGTLTLSNAADATATGTGGTIATGGVGGVGTGGTAALMVDGGGRTDVAQRFNGTANGFGSNGLTGPGGAGRGGNVNVQIAAGGGTLNLSGGALLTTQGTGGSGVSGGAGTGGTALFTIAGPGSFLLGANTQALSNGAGGVGSTGAGGAGTGGAVNVSAQSTGATLTVRGTLDLQANGIGSGSNGGAGGAGTGGTININAMLAAIAVQGATTASALGTGANAGSLGGAAGGAAAGGGIFAVANSGASASTLSFQGVTLNAGASAGVGGSGGSGGQSGGRGGDATGGTIQLTAQAQNGQLTATVVTADATAAAGAGGIGGPGATGGPGGRGGDAFGGGTGFGTGAINIGTVSGPVAPVLAGYNRTSSITATSNTFGGAGGAGGGTSGGVGGAGGNASNSGAGILARGSEVTTGAVVLNVNATGGNGGNGGAGSTGAIDGRGGDALVAGLGAGVLAKPHTTNGAPVNVTIASLTANANAFGGSSGTGVAGNATAGEAYVRLEQSGAPSPDTANTGSVAITGAANLSANGTGGGTGTGRAGAGTGGLAHFVGIAGTTTLGNAANAAANGTGGTIVTGGVGGAGTGGTAEILVDSGGRTDVAQRFNGGATGTGSNGLTGSGGAGQGGVANAQIAPDGGILNLTGGTQLVAQGRGGTGAAGGGAGRGGTANVAGNSSFTDGAGTDVQLQGLGGTSSAALGGMGIGGTGTVGAATGTARFAGPVTVTGSATGGGSGAGTGGAATGGAANVRSGSGTTTVTGAINASAVAIGGASSAGNGGAGTGGSATVGTLTSAGLFTANGTVLATGSGTGGAGAGAGSTGGAGVGTLAQILGYGAATFTGSAQVAAIGQGGTGATGGAGTGGNARVVAVESATAGGSLSLTTVTGQLTLTAQGSGGAGLAGFGGAGGKGTGGSTYLGVTATGFNSQLTAPTTIQTANGIGGAGGAGAAGQAGGRGGDGVGGMSTSGSNTSGGTVTVGALTQAASGLGGTGGVGGNGAAGGIGGNGLGGTTGSGTPSMAVNAPIGSFTWASVNGQAIGVGGNGGAGGSGGRGGLGGNGTGGYSTVGGNGGAMTVTGLTQLNAIGRGGNGGTGTVQGAGGDGAGGNAGAGVGAPFAAGATNTLTGGSLNVFANGVAGAGSTLGQSFTGGSVVVASFGSVRFADIFLQASGASASIVPSPLGFIASGIGAFNGSVTTSGYAYLGNDLNNTTPTGFGRDGALATDNGSINIGGDLYLSSARNITSTLTGTAATMPGTVTAGGGAVFDAGGSLTINSRVVALGSDASFDAGTTTTLADVRSNQDITINGDGNVVTGNLSAGDSIQIDSQQSRAFGAELSGFTVTTGNLDAGTNTPSTNGNAGYQVGITGDAGVTTGAIAARGNVGLASYGGSVTAGSIATTKTIGLIAANAVSTGALASGTTASDYVFISNPTVFTRDPNFDAAGPPAGFDFSPFVVLTPKPVAGNIAVGGVTTGRFSAATDGTLSAGAAINASAGFFARANLVAIGDLIVGGPNELDLFAVTNLTAGNIRGEDDVYVEAGGTIRVGSVSAGDSIFILSNVFARGSTVTTGALDAGMLRPSTDPTARYGVVVDATGGATVASVDARGAAGIVSRGGAINTGAIKVGLSTALLAGADVTAASITTGTAGTTLIAADSMASLIVQTPQGVDYTALLAATPVRLNGSISVAGAVDTGSFKAASSGAFSAAAIKAAQLVNINAGALANFMGLVDSPTITVRSGDITIGQSGGLGTAATNLVTLQVDPNAAAITIGDASAQTGWTLDNAEAGRVRAKRTLIQPLSTQPPTVRIGTLTLSGSAGTSPNLAGQNASFEVQTPRAIQVVGAVSVANAGATDTLRLAAGTRLDVLTDGGGALGLTGATGGVAGTLDLTGRDVFVGSSTLANQLIADPAFTGRNDALAATPATANLAGSLGANTIQVTSGGTVLIQNSGSRTQRAGFTAGPGGFRVTASQSTTPVDVVINGRAFDDGGTALTNGNTVQRVTLTPSQQGAGFTTTSSVNGCVIGSTCTTGIPGAGGGFPGTPEQDPVMAAVEDIGTNVEAISDDDERKIEAAQQAATKEVPQVRIEKLISTLPLVTDPVVDEPVTSGGNSSLWIDPEPPLTTGPGEHP